MAQPWMKEEEENAAVPSLMSGGQNVEKIPTASAEGNSAAICWTVRRRAPSDRSRFKLCPSHLGGIILGAR